MSNQSNLIKGNFEYRKGNYKEALELYKVALKESPGLEKIIQKNIDLIIRKNSSNTEIKLVESLKKENKHLCKIETKYILESESSGANPNGKMILVSMVRNEGASLNNWLSHVLTLFDEIHIVDHASNDGSRELLECVSDCFPNVFLYHYDQPGYLQNVIMTHIARYQIDADMNDWVFFLDADEFLPFASKFEFIDKMRRHGLKSIIKLPWLNLIPETYDCEDYIHARYLKPNTPSSVSKFAFRLAYYKDVNFEIEQGNHYLVVNGKRVESRNAFNIFHIPVRSENQIKSKIRNGISAYRAINEHGESIGYHWFEIEKYLASNKITQEHLNGMVRVYSEKDQPIIPVTTKELVDIGYSAIDLDVGGLTRDSILVAGIGAIYSKFKQYSKSGSSLKTVHITDSKIVDVNQVNLPISSMIDEVQPSGNEITIRILDRDYVVPLAQFSKKNLKSAAQLCEKELLAFLGSRSFAHGSFILDYLGSAALHTVFVADRLKTCKMIRLCRSPQEAEFVRLMCNLNKITNVVALSPEEYRSNFLDNIQALIDKLSKWDTVYGHQIDKNVGFLLLGDATRKDVDTHLKRWFSNTGLPLSIFEFEDSSSQNTWRVRKPSNIFCMSSTEGFSRSNFAMGGYTPLEYGLDIAVAMYNTPKYIIDCVDSLISIDRDDINVIIVNDGSTDDSLEVVTHRYANHPRVKILSKINGGCASARNYGRLHSNRTHITFVDSDDFCDPNMFAKLYDLSLYTGAEVTQGGFDFYHEGAEQEYVKSYEDELFANYDREDFRNQQIIRVNASDLICGQPTIWRRVYRRDFLDAKRIYFPENIRAYDDYIFHTLSIYYARDIYMIPDIKMHYRQHAAQDIKQGDERHFYEIYMFKQLLRRSIEEGWDYFGIFLPSIFNSMNWSLQTLRDDLVGPFAHAAASFLWCVEKVYGSSVTANLNLSVIKVEKFHEELMRLRNGNQDWHHSYIWAYIECIDNHPITLSMQNCVK